VFLIYATVLSTGGVLTVFLFMIKFLTRKNRDINWNYGLINMYPVGKIAKTV